VRSVGLLAGVELDAAARARTPDLVERVVRRARTRGVLVRNLVGHTLQISPPFVIDAEELTLLAEVLRAALDDTAEELADQSPAVGVGDQRQTA
ncbi:MAG: hypothetical protein ACRDL4_03140, partial [Thermoleophilaceae bacterium]